MEKTKNTQKANWSPNDEKMFCRDQMVETILEMHHFSPVITLLKSVQQEKLWFNEDLRQELVTFTK